VAKIITWKESDESVFTRLDVESEKIRDILIIAHSARLVGEGHKLHSPYQYWILELPDAVVPDAFTTLRTLKERGANFD